MDRPSFAQFEAAAHGEGYDEVVERIWNADQTTAEHKHPFAVKALVVAGEMWLMEPAGTKHLRAGERFELAASVPHAERYGPEGATVWAARRNPR
jgi:quercetin dioxygenase-like cupin family protein